MYMFVNELNNRETMTSFFRKICLEKAVRFTNGPYRCGFRSNYAVAVLKDGRVIFKTYFFLF